METGNPRNGHLMAGAGGVLLILSLFLPWADAGGVDVNGWEFSTTSDILFLIVGLLAIATALTGGLIGVMRPDVSLIGATDLLAVVSTVLLAWLLIADFPDGAGRGIGVFLALISTIAIAAGTGDYRPLRGAAWFPRL